ncbi:MAG: translation elongation factor Ts [Bacteroidales bacterium]|nr:translation elongation factor Ts [Bacteroidales bacterium]
MANVTAADVNKLRHITGAGIMDCKNALVEADGDFEKAIDALRKKGQKVASKRADKEANEGVVLAKTSDDNKKAFIIMINCETDFVARNQEFVDFTSEILNVAVQNSPKNIEELSALKLSGLSVSEKLNEMLGKIGEKIQLSKYAVIDAAKVFAYIHPGNRLASIVGFNKETSTEAGKDIAMQIAAMSPVAIDKADVDPALLAREREIFMEQVRLEGKPEQMIEKITEGKINKFFNESTLLNQEFIKDNKKTVRQYLQETDKELQVTEFKRFQLGS